MNIILFAALASGLFDTGYSRHAEVYTPMASELELFERQISYSHGVGCSCTGCVSTRSSVAEMELDGFEARRRAMWLEDEVDGEDL